MLAQRLERCQGKQCLARNANVVTLTHSLTHICAHSLSFVLALTHLHLHSLTRICTHSLTFALTLTHSLTRQVVEGHGTCACCLLSDCTGVCGFTCLFLFVLLILFRSGCSLSLHFLFLHLHDMLCFVAFVLFLFCFCFCRYLFFRGVTDAARIVARLGFAVWFGFALFNLFCVVLFSVCFLYSFLLLHLSLNFVS